MESLKRLLKIVLHSIWKLFGKNLSDESFEVLFEFFKFALVGFTNTFLSYFVYLFVWSLLQQQLTLKDYDYIISQTVAFVLGVLWSFYWNHKLVFQDSRKSRNLWSSLCKTFISYSFTGLFLSNLLLFLWVDILHLSEIIAPLFNLIISVPINFLLNKFWSFKL